MIVMIPAACEIARRAWLGAAMVVSAGVLAALLPAASHAQSPQPMLELTDRFLGFKYTLYNADWAFSPAGRHGTVIVNARLDARLLIKRALKRESVEKAIAGFLARPRDGGKIAIKSLDEGAPVLGAVPARGLIYEAPPGTRRVLKLWFSHNRDLFEAECDARIGSFTRALPLCLVILKRMEPAG